MAHPTRLSLVLVVALVGTASLSAQEWANVPIIQHSDYQAVDALGNSAYSQSFPIRLRGVVLNDTEDWLDPTADYDSGVHLWQMGGEAEFYMQAVNLDGTPWDPNPTAAFDDFGGTACWVGQNYGNHIMKQDPAYNYTDAAWYAELDRLRLYRPETAVDPIIRAGDLVEVRARAGLNYKGKMNVNEQHNNNPLNDFEIVLLEQGYGLPTPTDLTLSDIKDATDAHIFDATRATGGERYQSTLVELRNVALADPSGWGSNSDLTLIDATGRTLTMHLGLDESFDLMPAPSGYFDVTGILDQSSTANVNCNDGYKLLVMDAAALAPVPEPTTVALLLSGALAGLVGVLRRRRR